MITVAKRSGVTCYLLLYSVFNLIEMNLEDLLRKYEVSTADNEEFLKELQSFIHSKCKETAKNVRHMSADLVSENVSICQNALTRGIINIQYDKVSPNGV